MKIYTKTGDAGETGLFAGPRVAKDDARIEAYGTVDELNAVLGLARAQAQTFELTELVQRVQNELFVIGAELATPAPERLQMPRISDEHVDWLETQIDQHEQHLPELKEFILPGGHPVAATLHLARVVCRRAERRTVSLSRTEAESVSPVVLRYLNRLSDLLFVLARAANAAHATPDVAWNKPTG